MMAHCLFGVLVLIATVCALDPDVSLPVTPTKTISESSVYDKQGLSVPQIYDETDFTIPQAYEKYGFSAPTQALPSPNAIHSCSCGYAINSTSSPSYALYTQLLETDFLHLKGPLNTNKCWRAQSYNVSAAVVRGTYGKEANLANVILNPLKSDRVWTGQGVQGNEAGLQLWVDSQTTNGLIQTGEIASVRGDMLYGSYRIGMKVTSVPGTCTGFFWYRNNSEEIDMELLSKNYNNTDSPIYLVMQTPQSLEAGYNAQGTPTYAQVSLPFVPYEDFHEYRFDWSPTKTSFYADGQWLQDLVYTYPSDPGHLTINHWSNGNPLWSGGPPTTNAVVTISYIKVYFNSSDPSVQESYEKKCASDILDVCQIPDFQTATGETPFFDRGMCDESADSSSSSGGTSSSSAASTSLNGYASSIFAAIPAGTSSSAPSNVSGIIIVTVTVLVTVDVVSIIHSNATPLLDLHANYGPL